MTIKVLDIKIGDKLHLIAQRRGNGIEVSYRTGGRMRAYSRREFYDYFRDDVLAHLETDLERQYARELRVQLHKLLEKNS